VKFVKSFARWQHIAVEGGFRRLRCPFVCLSICLFVCSSVACEICEVTRYVAAPGSGRGLLASSPSYTCFSGHVYRHSNCHSDAYTLRYLPAAKPAILVTGVIVAAVCSWSLERAASIRFELTHSLGSRPLPFKAGPGVNIAVAKRYNLHSGSRDVAEGRFRLRKNYRAPVFGGVFCLEKREIRADTCRSGLFRGYSHVRRRHTDETAATWWSRKMDVSTADKHFCGTRKSNCTRYRWNSAAAVLDFIRNELDVSAQRIKIRMFCQLVQLRMILSNLAIFSTGTERAQPRPLCVSWASCKCRISHGSS